MLAAANGKDYERAIAVLAGSEDVDAIIVIFTPPFITKGSEVVRAIHRAAHALPRAIPVLSVFMSKQAAPRVIESGGVRIPHYPFPEEAARALSLIARYGAWRAAPEETLAEVEGVDGDRAAAVIATALAAGPGWMASEAVAELLMCYGIPMVETRQAVTAHEAGLLAKQMGVEVALKAIAAGVLHKSDAGAVRLHLSGANQVEHAAKEMADALEQAGHHVSVFEVQPLVPEGVEMLVGVVQDQHFGPVLACGAGGTTTELLKDVSVRITPITKSDADRMVRSLKTFPRLDGFRGAARADVPALEDVLLRVSALVEAHPEVAEMDLNPLIVQAAGAVVVDARIRLEPGAPRPPIGAR
jgi:acyl-CoA synthetase (NDP forming)